MITRTLDVGERKDVWWPFWGVPENVTPDIQIGQTGAWRAMTADPGYVADPPVAAGARWFKALLAHPAAAGNPSDAIIVPIGTNLLSHRVTGAGGREIDVPDEGEWITAL